MPVAPGRPGPLSPPGSLATDVELAAAVAAHTADTSAVHGITDTTTLATIQDTATTALVQLRSTTPTAHTPHLIPLVDGSETATLAFTNCTGSLDYGLTKDGSKAGRTLTSTGDGTYLQFSYIPAAPLTIGPCQAICVWVYVPDPDEFTNVTVHLYHNAAYDTDHRWSKSLTSTGQTLAAGWNFMRVRATDQDAGGISRTTLKTQWGIVDRVIVIVSGPGTITTGNTATIGHVYAERQDKAKVIMAADRPYLSFYSAAYPDLVEIGVPVTFNVDVQLLGTGSGINVAMTEAQVATAAAENGNSISFHGYTGGATSAMSAAELAAENTLCINWLQAEGYPGRIWRGSYVQNTAAAGDHPTVQAQIVASRSYQGNTDEDMWPPADPYNIGNQGPDNSRANDAAMEAEIDDWFTILEVTHLTRNILVHKIDEDDTYSTKAAIWDYMLAKITAGVEEGWLEGVTFEDLFLGSGGTLTADGAGGVVVSWPRNLTGDRFPSVTVY